MNGKDYSVVKKLCNAISGRPGLTYRSDIKVCIKDSKSLGTIKYELTTRGPECKTESPE